MTMVNPSSRQRRTIPLDSNETPTAPHNNPCHHFFVKERSIVFFNDWNISIQIIERLDDMTLWYSKTDYNLFSAHDELLVKLARAGNFYETVEHSIRGLEKQLGDGTINDVEHMAMEAVQEEQQRQYQHGIHNPDVIANIYRLASMSSKHEARIRGIQDALQVYQSPMLGFSIDGEHFACDEPNRRRKPRSRSMLATTTTEVDHSSSHRSVRHSFHSHPITRTDRKSSRYVSSLHERIVNTEIPNQRPSLSTPRRKARSVSMLGSSAVNNSNAQEASSEQLSLEKVSEKQNSILTPRRKPRSVSMLGSITSNNSYVSEASPEQVIHAPQKVTEMPSNQGPVKTPRRKARSVSMLGSITSNNSYVSEASSEQLSLEKVTEKREPMPTPRRKARSVSMLGSTTSNSYANANEASSERLFISPHKTSSKTSSMRFLSSSFPFAKDAVTEECIKPPTNSDKVFARTLSKREVQKDGIAPPEARPRSPRRRRSSIEHSTKINIVQ